MNSVTSTAEQIEGRIAHFRNIHPMSRHYAAASGIPAQAFEMIAAKNIFLLMAPPLAAEKRPYSARARTELRDLLLSARPLRISKGDKGENNTMLKEFDLSSVPPRVTRTFTNVTDADAYLLVMIQGSNDDLSDVANSSEVAGRSPSDLVHRSMISPRTCLSGILKQEYEVANL